MMQDAQRSIQPASTTAQHHAAQSISSQNEKSSSVSDSWADPKEKLLEILPTMLYRRSVKMVGLY